MGMFPVVDLSGGAFERGRLHGERARDRVCRSLENYTKLFAFTGLFVAVPCINKSNCTIGSFELPFHGRVKHYSFVEFVLMFKMFQIIKKLLPL